MFRRKRKPTPELETVALAMTDEFERGTYGFYLYDELYYALREGLPLTSDDWKDLDYASWYFLQKRKSE